MKRIALLLTAAVSSLVLLTACGDTAEKATYTEEHVESNKSLVIYFDYSENIDTTGLDVDAITQASLRGGSTGKNIENLKVMVDEVRSIKSADVFSIQVNEVYPAKFEDMTGIAKDDIDEANTACMGRNIADTGSYLDNRYKGIIAHFDGMTFRKRTSALFIEMSEGKPIPLMPYARECLEALAKTPLKIALASSTRESTVRKELAQVDL